MLFFFFNDTATTEIYTLSLHDALPICLPEPDDAAVLLRAARLLERRGLARGGFVPHQAAPDRKSTRLNSSHMSISYAVFCLKKKKRTHTAPVSQKLTCYVTSNNCPPAT